MKSTKLMSFILALLVTCPLLIACGGSKADKAYDSWIKGSGAKLEETTDKFLEDFTADLDNETKLEMLDSYIAVLKSAVAEFEQIDEAGLTGARKDAYPGQLDSISESVTQYEDLRDKLVYAMEVE